MPLHSKRSIVRITLALLALWATTSSQVAHAQQLAAPGSVGTSASELGLVDLDDDLSRQALFGEVLRATAIEDPGRAAAQVEYFNLNGPFRFPTDTTYDRALKQPRNDSIFGVDISHHTDPAFPIENLRRRNVAFLYIKATQADKYLDKRFAEFWARAGKLAPGDQVHRGAYHFLSAGTPGQPAVAWAEAQAAAFVKVVRANGGLQATDLPPVVDLEWDKAGKDAPDRWKDRSVEDIHTMLKTFLQRVETELQRKPMVYTAKAWWNERFGSDAGYESLGTYPLWLADYSTSSRASEKPRTIAKLPWALWQFTESATLALGFNAGFDASVFKGTPEDFRAKLGIAGFVE